PSNTTGGIEEAFDIPDDLRLTPGDDFIAAGPEGGPFKPQAQTYTLVNVGINPTPWSAILTSDWLEISPAEGVLAPGGSATNLLLRPRLVAQSLPPGLYPDTVTLTNHL